jgi:hypothetical protein
VKPEGDDPFPICVQLRENLLAILKLVDVTASQMTCSQVTEESRKWPQLAADAFAKLSFNEAQQFNLGMDANAIAKRGPEEEKKFRKKGQTGEAHLLSLPRYTCAKGCEIGRSHYGECINRPHLRSLGHFH